MKANDIKEAVRTAALNAACFLAVVGPVEEAHARCCSCVSIGANDFVLTVFRKQQVGFFFFSFHVCHVSINAFHQWQSVIL